MAENRPEDSFDAIVDQMADKLANSVTRMVGRVSDRAAAGQQGQSKNIIVKPSIGRDGRGITFAGVGVIALGIFTGFGALFTTIFSSRFGSFTGICAAIFLAAGIGLCLWGSRERALSRNLQSVANAMASRVSVGLDELSSMVALPIDRLRSLIRRSIKRGYIPQGHLATVAGRETLFLTDGSYNDFLAAERDYNTRMREQAAAEQAKDARDAQLPEDAKAVVAACKDFTQRTAKATLSIGNAETREKVAVLDGKVVRVANHIRNHPDDAHRLDRYIGYYLPTTAKLIESYAELDTLQADGENADIARRDVDEAVENLAEASDKLLDDLIRDTQWDVSSDAKVMKTMLYQDGLMDDNQ